MQGLPFAFLKPTVCHFKSKEKNIDKMKCGGDCGDRTEFPYKALGAMDVSQ
jgi:hypothetical protein